jgi:hypothetical protein
MQPSDATNARKTALWYPSEIFVSPCAMDVQPMRTPPMRTPLRTNQAGESQYVGHKKTGGSTSVDMYCTMRQNSV